MRLAITGAAGFVGRAVVEHLVAHHPAIDLLLADRDVGRLVGHETLAGDLRDPATIAALTDDSVDAVLHLAALPGDAAEQAAALSRAINLDVPLNLIERMAGRRIVIAGSIGVFGGPLPDPVNDKTVPRLVSVYGTHKRMVELGFADAVRRGVTTGMVLRLPGIVARPAAAGGFGSAFLSDIFHAARTGTRLTLPVAPDATSWLMSVECCATNLVAAALDPRSEADAITLPALRVPMDALLAELGANGDIAGIDHAENATTRAKFGSYPALLTPRAEALDFRHDGSVAELVMRVLTRLSKALP